MAQVALAAHGQKDLVLAAAPVGTRIEVQDFHAALAYTIAAAGAIPTMASVFAVGQWAGQAPPYEGC